MEPDTHPLTEAQISQLKQQGCSSSDWSGVRAAENFKAERVRNVHFSGAVEIGELGGMISFYGGLERPAGIYDAAIHNCKIGSNVYINNISNYIANYLIEDEVVIENVDLLAVEGESSFGNGTKCSVLNEAGGREVIIYDHLTAQIAYIVAIYRHRKKVIENIEKMISEYVSSVTSSRGLISAGSRIVNCGTIKNVKTGAGAVIEGAARLENGTINSCSVSPAYIGQGVAAENFIISEGAKVTDGTILERCFMGQSVILGRQFSAENSAFFANCEGFHGEACSLFAGPYSVSHHKSTLLIAMMCSFYNAGSGSNQSNHMYKLGPVHQGVLERGAKTGSYSYLFWPARVGAFSTVIGKHYARFDSSQMPFSYIVEEEGKSVLVPAVNLATVGTVRDAGKWPKRDKRKADKKLDLINFKSLALNPFTVGKMVDGRQLLVKLNNQAGDGEQMRYGELFLHKKDSEIGIELYQGGIDKFVGDCVVERIGKEPPENLEQLRSLLTGGKTSADENWVDMFGVLLPGEVLEDILTAVEKKSLTTVDEIEGKLKEAHERYSEYEWGWVCKYIEETFGKSIEEISAEDVCQILRRWRKAVEELNGLILKDAKKEFEDFSMIGYGVDGGEKIKEADFEMVRGRYEENSFVRGIEEDTAEKTKLADELIAKISGDF